VETTKATTTTVSRPQTTFSNISSKDKSKPSRVRQDNKSDENDNERAGKSESREKERAKRRANYSSADDFLDLN
jgi:hypothetical protein